MAQQLMASSCWSTTTSAKLLPAGLGLAAGAGLGLAAGVAAAASGGGPGPAAVDGGKVAIHLHTNVPSGEDGLFCYDNGTAGGGGERGRGAGAPNMGLCKAGKGAMIMGRRDGQGGG